MADADLAARVQLIEDQLAIFKIVCGYGYGADGLNPDAVGDLYTEDGVYQVNDVGAFEGRAAVRAIIEGDDFHAAVGQGLAHLSTVPYVVVDGNRAVATCHTLLGRYQGESGYVLGRISASRIELERTDQWRIIRRTNQVLNGDPRGPELLHRFMDGPAQPGDSLHTEPAAALN